MGTRKTTTNRGALLIPDARMVDTTFLAANDGTANNSDFSESTPRPGSAVTTDARAMLRPLVKNGQSVDINFRASQGGYPKRNGNWTSNQADSVYGLQGIYKLDSGAATKWKGWIPPKVAMGWTAVKWSDTVAYPYHDIQIIPSTQTPIAIYGTTTLATDITTTTLGYDSPAAWSTPVAPTFSPALTGGGEACCLVVIPGTERILAFGWDPAHVSGGVSVAIGVSYSDDAGATWTAAGQWTWSASPFGGSTDAVRMRACYQSTTGTIMMLVSEDGGTGDLLQLASSDLGESWTEVEAVQATWGHDVSCFSLPGGSIGIVYRKNSDNLPYFIKLGSAFEPISGSTSTVIDSSPALGALAAYADHDGTINVYCRTATTATHADEIRVNVSHDLGDNWCEEDNDLFYANGDNSTNYLTNFSACPGVLLHQWVAANGDEDGSIGSFLCGGWSDLTLAKGSPGFGYTSWGGTAAGSNVDARVYIPIELPEDMGDWGARSAGTAALTAGALNVTTAATTSTVAMTTFSALELDALLLVRVNDDNSGTIDQMEFRIANNTDTQYVVILRLSETSIALYDSGGTATVPGTATGLDLLNDPMLIAITFDGDTEVVSLWYCRLGDSVWTAGPTGTLTSATGAVTGRIRMGPIASCTSDTDTFFFGFRIPDSAARQDRHWGQYGTASTGRAISEAGAPIPGVGTSTASAILAAKAGPARANDAWDIAAEHDYPIEHSLIGVHPSTRRVWRSTDKTAQTITFTLANQATMLGAGYSMGVAALNCNWRTADVDGYTTAGGWTTLGSFDMDAGGGSATVAGETIRPSGGTGARYTQHGEHIGGYALMSGVPNKARKIAGHGGGWWTSNTTAKPSYRFDGYDGTEPAGPSVVTISPSGVLIIHLAEGTHYERFRLVIDASQITPDDYYQIGSLLIGWVWTPGQQPSNGWSKRLVVQTEESESRAGVRRVRKTGEPRWEWTWSWVDGLLHSRLGVDANYRGSSVGAPITQDQDVAYGLAGIVRHDLKSGQIPVVALESMPDATGTTITAPDAWCYGHLSQDIQYTQVQGDDGSPEMVRVESITIRGLP